MISAIIDGSSIVAGLKQFKKDSKVASHFSMFDIANELLRLSQQQVPHNKGTLQNSGNVEVIGEDIVVGYHTPYAARLHEHPEYHFQRGRKGKYLTDPIIKNAHILGLKLDKDYKSRLG